MKRRFGFALLVALALVLAWLQVPTGHADSSDVETATSASNSPRPSATDKDQVRINAAGLPNILDERAPLSAALVTAIGAPGSIAPEVSLLADFSGRENYVADRGAKLFNTLVPDISGTMTRVAVSAHTVANGFNENVSYYGDSTGRFYIATDTAPTINPGPGASTDVLSIVEIRQLISTLASGGFTLLNPQAGDCTDDQVAITGIAVNPVADLGDFGLCDTVGEVVYVSTLDTGGCSSNAANQPFRTRIFAFAFTDVAGGVAPAGVIQIARNSLSNSGIAIDDDGSLYFHLQDRLNVNNGAAIFKVTENARTVAGCAVNPRVNRVVASVPSGLSGGIGLNTGQGTASNPVLTAGGMRLTNYSGPSTTWGNIAAIAAAPGQTIYAAVARSFVSGDDAATQATEGQYTNPAALGATPSMIIAFTDTSGANSTCHSPIPGVQSGIPTPDGFSDGPPNVARTPGVNNFRVFALGNGPDIRPVPPATSLIATANTLKLDMQVDATIYAGIAVDEEGTVFVLSGGTPAGLGLNPSPQRGEILAFQDQAPADLRADFIDFRGNAFPGTNNGDGDSDRFDHIYWQAPNDPATLTPAGVSGLARGFLRYTNRLAPNPISPGITLGTTAPILADDGFAGPILFEGLDPSHQVAGGSDQNAPFRGDDSNGSSLPAIANNPVLAGALEGGFEFSFGAPGSNVWNAFFLNANGHISFGDGNSDFSPTVEEFRSGLPRIAPAWVDLNAPVRAGNPANFPLYAIGFANVNAFKVRYINVAEFGQALCTGNDGGKSNTFAVTLYDDGTGVDENASQALNPANPIGNNAVPFDKLEGPTDLRFTREPTTNVIVGAPPRAEGSGYFVFDYARMNVVGATNQAAITGYTIGALSQTNPPGLCEVNLGEAQRAAEGGAFGVVGESATIAANLIGEGTEPTVYEVFNEGENASIGSQGQINLAEPDYDLRHEGINPLASTPPRQRDLNKGRIGFVGFGLPPAPVIQSVVPGPFVVAPNQPNVLINALGPVDIFLVGSGFLPNEVTTVCAGTAEARPGKTVTTAITLGIDNNADSIPDVVLVLTNVTPVNSNLLRGTLATVSGLPGTAFPLAAIGPNGVVTATTTFTSGDNNAFGPITRVASSPLFLGNRAPVVITSVPGAGDCSTTQVLALEGGAFLLGNGSPNVTSVTAVNNGTSIPATSFVINDVAHLTATFNFPPGSGGQIFRIFANGPNGTSRNLTSLPPGTPPGVPLGNEAGQPVVFSCGEAFQFSIGAVAAVEACTTIPITVNRTNPSASTTTVDFATTDGTAQQRSDYSIAIGKLIFGPNETSKTINLLINEDSFVEPPETLTVTLSNPSSGGLGSQSSTVVTITDNDTVGNLVPAPKLFVASLRGSEEVPANPSTARGTAVVLLNTAETQARVSLQFSGLSSAQTAAHIHGPGAVGVNAPVLFPLPNGSFNEFVIAMTPSQVADLKNGLHYVNVHSATSSAGEIRGQLRFNPIDDPANYVCQLYHDFLNRDPDPGGLAFWTDQITSCGANTECISNRRIAVAASFFFSQEFQDTGFYVIRLYRLAFNQSQAVRPTFLEFFGDRSFFDGGGNLDAQKLAFAELFVTRPEFIAAFPLSLTPAQYVDALNANSGNALTTAERDALVADLTNATQTRGSVLRTIADNPTFSLSQANAAMIAMEYLGLLRRGADLGGFNFWLAHLNNTGNTQSLVCAFVTSAEYQSRFGPEITRNDAECAP